MNLTNLTPLGDRILVKRLDEAKMQSSIIEVIQDAARPSFFSVVLAVGTGVRETISVGDTIITKPFSGAPVEVLVDGVLTDAFVITAADALAVETA